VTGNALGSDVTYFINHGADAVLAKPFDLKLFKQLMWQTRESK
jgi:CheY-like chemotaxis protein